MALSKSFLLLLGAAGGAVLAQGGPTVKIANGTLQGAKCPASEVNSFLSIPYAKPPVGDLRFAPPQGYDQSYSGTRDATQAAPACPQFNAAFAEAGPQSEDCLFIDVWAPANATASSRLPVRVWLYGGGNAAGGISNPLYGGCPSSTQTIQVSINYRVGPLGFLALESLGLRGNFGIQDQALGLRWVQENIAAFGGDPRKVMLFGQSAGSSDTLIHAAAPSATSVMHSAILQSGAGRLSTLAGARAANEAFVKAINCSLSDAACVKRADVEAMRSVLASQPGSLGLGLSLSSVVDGQVIPAQPLDAGLQVPTVIGSTTLEGSLFYLAVFREGALTLNASVYDAFLNQTFGAAAGQVKQEYPVSKFNSTLAPVFNAMSTVLSLASFRCPSRRALRSAAKGVPVYTYSFGHGPSCPWYASMPPEAVVLLGPAHTAEIPFVLGQVDGLPGPNGTCSFTDAEKVLSATMRSAWDNMAATGNPGSNWPAYSEPQSMGINVGSDASFTAGMVDYSMCDFFDNLAAAQANGTSTAPPGTSPTSTGRPPTATANGASSGLSGYGSAWLCLLTIALAYL